MQVFCKNGKAVILPAADKIEKMYKKAGILDVRGFYRDKFAFKQDYDFTTSLINFYHIDNFKLLWIFSNIKENSRVLDFGCGSGVLSCLKRKGCEITGIDYSETALKYAKSINQYDHVHSVDINDYDNYNYFDYVVSIDVFGHIPFEDKDKVIEKLKQFLKPGGTMLHGIECGEVDYAAMSKEKLKKFIEVDGHVGIEGKTAIINRFKRVFKFVSGEVRFDIVNSVSEYIKTSTAYDMSNLEDEFIDYLKNLNEQEAFAFNVSSGLTQHTIENNEQPSLTNAGGFLLLKASDREMKHHKMQVISGLHRAATSLIEDDGIFHKGWWKPENNEDRTFRWSNGNSVCRIVGQSGKTLHFEFYSSYPGIREKHINVFFLESKRLLKTITLIDHKAVMFSIAIDRDEFQLQIFCDTRWVPGLLQNEGFSRELGIAVYNFSIE